LGNYEVAENIADRLLARNDRNAVALVLKARIAAFHQKMLDADKWAANAVECDPGCGLAWYSYACLRRKQDDLQSSYDFMRKAFECSPEARDIALGFHESSLIVQRLAEAEAAIRTALSGRRVNRRLHFLLIDLLLRQNKSKEAMRAVESAIVEFGADRGILSSAVKIREALGPMTIPMTAVSGGTVSLCIIVKNEKNHLSRCLESAKPVVDEIIVVDTGSDDETKDIARIFGARVYDFKWSHDFSAARNYALSKAAADWILVLDADETLSPSDYANLKKVLEHSAGQPAAYRIQTRNYSNQVNTLGFRSNRGEYAEEKGMGWFPSDKVRLFPNDPRIRFEYPVHELVEPSLQRHKIPIQECSFPIHHYGTLDEAHAIQKRLKYKKLGNKKLRIYSKNHSALKEAAVQSARTGNHAEALELWRRFVKLEPNSAEAYLNMGSACWNLRRHAKAEENARIALALDPALKEAKFNLALALLAAGRAGEVKVLLEALLRECPDYPAAQFILCVAHICMGENEPAQRLFGVLRALPFGEFIGESFLDIAERFMSASRRDYARRTLEAALEFGCHSAGIQTLLQSCHSA
jgi:tetratricopeptide (TPR) repeat protein